ncbi:LPXTG cell wall anchor domain-containing protein [Facklamia hominis]|uniref:LPXTG cell wall anchor domain-containing protein n=1 Tax=Facklamia hominis TaxID=178214 RepID=UPI00288B3BEC|nr:G5 domain-containing protein [Facklamia hominis]
MKKIPYTALSDINFSERRIIQKGQMGLKRTFTEVTTHANGKVTRKILDYTADDRLPIDEIIEVGTKVVSQPSPSQGQAGDEKPVQPEQPSKETNKPSQEQAQGQPKESNNPAQGQTQGQPKESNNPAQGQTQGHPADKESLVPSNPQAAVLPQTGESDPSLIFGMAALSILASVGLVTPRSKRQ